MMFCLGQGLRSGTRAAVAASAGISTGAMVHVAMAGAGLGALVATLPWLFDVIRWGGVAYLLWLAWAALRSGGMDGTDVQPLSARQAFRQGFIVNLSNPKVILFVLAFVPQFVDPTKGAVFLQFITFGAIISTGGFIVNGMVGAFSGTVGKALTGSVKFQRGIGYATAAIFTGLAARLAIMEKA
ncbi:MAG: LysE family translocator [Cognatishimia sp.]